MQVDIEQPDQLLAYLRHNHRVGGDEQPRFRVLAGGVSNRTVLVERATGEAWVLKQALPKLRVAVDWFSSPERIHREAEGLRWLAKLAPPGTTTPLVFEDHELHILAMQAVPEPHANWKTMLLAGQVEPDHVAQFGRLLGTIHHNASERHEAVARAFGDRSFFESLRVEPYYGYTAGQLPAAAPFLTQLIEETRATRVTLVHGDYSPKNVLVRQGRLVLLDHEVIHFGDGAFDLGFGLAHLLSKAHHLPVHRQEFGEAANLFWRSYREALGNVAWASYLEARAVRHTLACLLARVAGRSPLEYLAPAERQRQAQVVQTLLPAAPPTIAALVEHWKRGFETYVDDSAAQ